MNRALVYVLLVIAALAWGCKRTSPGTAQSSPPAVVEVVMRNMQFLPPTLEIKKGETIEWKNDDITPHTATSPSFGDSGSIASGQSWQHTFTEAGNFPYACTFHPTMRGVVIVK